MEVLREEEKFFDEKNVFDEKADESVMFLVSDIPTESPENCENEKCDLRTATKKRVREMFSSRDTMIDVIIDESFQKKDLEIQSKLDCKEIQISHMQTELNEAHAEVKKLKGNLPNIRDIVRDIGKTKTSKLDWKPGSQNVGQNIKDSPINASRDLLISIIKEKYKLKLQPYQVKTGTSNKRNTPFYCENIWIEANNVVKLFATVDHHRSETTYVDTLFKDQFKK